MRYLIFTYSEDESYTTAYADEIPERVDGIRVFERNEAGLYIEIFL